MDLPNTTTQPTPDVRKGQIWSDEHGSFEVVAVGRMSVVISQLDGHGGIIDVDLAGFAHCTLVEDVA